MPEMRDFFASSTPRRPCPTSPNAKDIGRAKGEVEFEDVNFSYDGKRPAIEDFSFTVPAGRDRRARRPDRRRASPPTLSLLHRMLDPQSGAIRIDGDRHRDIKLTSLRRNIGVVFQEPMLFYRSIGDNLRVGKPDATEAELIEAARARRRRIDFITRQTDGLRHHGRRARPHRCRAASASGWRSPARCLKNPPILILDEATSALDAATEARSRRRSRGACRAAPPS